MRSLHLIALGLGSLGLLAASAQPQGDAFPAPTQAAPVQPAPATTLRPAIDDSASDAPAEAGEAVELPPVVLRYSGSWQEGYDELRTSYEEGDLERAIATADALLQPSLIQLWRELTLSQGAEWKRKVLRALEPAFETLGLMQPGDVERAELRFAHGALKAEEARQWLQEAGKNGDQEAGEKGLVATEAAREDFLVARALAGPGELRRDATYSQSRVMAERAEEARLGIPEIREKLGLPALPPPPPAPTAPNADEQPDPDADLKAVRGLYLDAREPLLERVLLGAYDDEDVQANLELIQRRLRELAEIERQREEQEQQEQEQNQDPSESDEGEESEEESEQDEGEGENKESESPSEEQEPEDSPDEQEESEEEQQSEGETPEPEQEAPQDQPAEEAERFLTREEALRLLDRLQQIEEEGEKVRQQVRSGRRKPVKRDW